MSEKELKETAEAAEVNIQPPKTPKKPKEESAGPSRGKCGGPYGLGTPTPAPIVKPSARTKVR